MGYEMNRFEGEVDEELVCAICSGVLEDPLQAPVCEHAFCRNCITEWISRQPNCPVDRQAVTVGQLRPVPRVLKNLLARLTIHCDNWAYGCYIDLKLDTLPNHLIQCEYDPKLPVACEQGCGLIIPKDEVKNHSCLKELRIMLESQQAKFNDMQLELATQRCTINEHRQELSLFKDFLRAMRLSNPAVRAVAEQVELDELQSWSASLSRARVTRWGGMISTPDDELQLMVKQSLTETGCPLHIIDNLMQNCHEQQWPPGLSSLETRQNNRRLYENYICKRVPGKQAVLVLQCDNSHVEDHMMKEPGIVLIFAHGIE